MLRIVDGWGLGIPESSERGSGCLEEVGLGYPDGTTRQSPILTHFTERRIGAGCNGMLPP